MLTNEFTISDGMRKAAHNMVRNYYDHEEYYQALSSLVSEAFSANPWCVAYQEHQNTNSKAATHGLRLSNDKKAEIKELFNNAINSLVSSTIESLKTDGAINGAFEFKRKNNYYDMLLIPSRDKNHQNPPTHSR